MATEKTRAQQLFGEISPKFAELTDDVLFGDIWKRPGLSQRDRSFATCAALVATGKTEQMGSHFPLAIKNGVKREELIELIIHMAFYSGWPNAVSAMVRAKEIFKDNP